MHTKKKKFKTNVGARINVRADGPFMAYAIENGNRKHVLGPFRRDVWMLNITLEGLIKEFEINPNDGTNYEVDIKELPSAKSINSGIPVEVPLDCKVPQTTEQIVAKYVSEALFRQNEDKFESPEEADDFIEDEEDHMWSKYELEDMQEEEPLTSPLTEQNGNAEPEPQKSEKPAEDVPTEASEDIKQQATA